MSIGTGIMTVCSQPGTSSMAKRILPPVWLFLTILLMKTLDKYLPLINLYGEPWVYIGLAPLVVGLIIAAWSATLFHRAKTGVVPFSETTTIVTGGMYRFTRNPMYLGMVLVLLGVGILFGSLTPFLLIPVFAWIIQTVFILEEEKILEAQFGDEYLAFKQQVRRWI